MNYGIPYSSNNGNGKRLVKVEKVYVNGAGYKKLTTR